MIRDDKDRLAVSLQLGVMRKLRKIELLTGMSKSDIITMLILDADFEKLIHSLDNLTTDSAQVK